MPAIVSSPVRAVPGLGAAATRTVAGPVPESGDGSTQAAVAATLHAQTACVRTSRVTVPPVAGITAEGDDTSNRHAAASWATCAGVSLTAMAARRVTGSGFASTRYVILTTPWPSLADVMAIRAAV
jgi:hypothetical protein